ncbi:hypothetical protein ADUPG1_007199, partial [Aduncisulcus paluster]
MNILAANWAKKQESISKKLAKAKKKSDKSASQEKNVVNPVVDIVDDSSLHSIEPQPSFSLPPIILHPSLLPLSLLPFSLSYSYFGGSSQVVRVFLRHSLPQYIASYGWPTVCEVLCSSMCLSLRGIRRCRLIRRKTSKKTIDSHSFSSSSPSLSPLFTTEAFIVCKEAGVSKQTDEDEQLARQTMNFCLTILPVIFDTLKTVSPVLISLTPERYGAKNSDSFSISLLSELLSLNQSHVATQKCTFIVGICRSLEDSFWIDLDNLQSSISTKLAKDEEIDPATPSEKGLEEEEMTESHKTDIIENAGINPSKQIEIFTPNTLIHLLLSSLMASSISSSTYYIRPLLRFLSIPPATVPPRVFELVLLWNAVSGWGSGVCGGDLCELRKCVSSMLNRTCGCKCDEDRSSEHRSPSTSAIAALEAGREAKKMSLMTIDDPSLLTVTSVSELLSLNQRILDFMSSRSSIDINSTMIAPWLSFSATIPANLKNSDKCSMYIAKITSSQRRLFVNSFIGMCVSLLCNPSSCS